MSSRKSFILVTVDCLRAGHTGFMGYQRPTTPFLDSLAAESFVFPAAIVGGAPTYYSFPTILGSRHPLALGRDVLGLAPGEPSLASAFKQEGYATAAFSAANPYISSRFGYEQGFDTFRDFLDDEPVALADSASPENPGWASRLNRKLQKVRPTLGALGKVYDELYFQYCQRWAGPAVNSLDALRRFPAADVIVDHARAWLDSIGGAPFFLWLHLMDPHAPYYPAEKAVGLMGGDGVTPSRARYLNSYWNRSDLGPQRLVRHRDEIVGMYDAGIRWVDAQMARLADALGRSKRWDNCGFALTADHGEEFLDHGGRYHPPSRLMEELIHVPLLLRVPGAAKREVSKAPFSLLHLAPTLLDAMQVSAPPTFQGRSHWRAIRDGETRDDETHDEIAIAESVAECTNPFRRENRMGSRVLAIREARYKLILRFHPVTEHLYDLEADPREQAALPPTAEKAVRHRLLEAAREHLRHSRDGRDQSASLRARVRELRLEWMKPAEKASPAAS